MITLRKLLVATLALIFTCAGTALALAPVVSAHPAPVAFTGRSCRSLAPVAGCHGRFAATHAAEPSTPLS